MSLIAKPRPSPQEPILEEPLIGVGILLFATLGFVCAFFIPVICVLLIWPNLFMQHRFLVVTTFILLSALASVEGSLFARLLVRRLVANGRLKVKSDTQDDV